ncbi:MAG: type II secretion system F family protein [Desulfobulbaceae bacterium]|nr:type II secretion system F family protein [Desulfobulbaceae bacterium]
MALYEYNALDSQGRQQRGVVEALGQKAASRKLREQGLYPTKLALAGRGREIAQKSFFKRVDTLQLGVATRQLSTMLSAGMPLDEALATVAEQQHGARGITRGLLPEPPPGGSEETGVDFIDVLLFVVTHGSLSWILADRLSSSAAGIPAEIPAAYQAGSPS